MASRILPDGARPRRYCSIGHEGGEPMQTLRASAIALPFVALAVLVGVLNAVIGLAK
jgi:hypothetical protein